MSARVRRGAESGCPGPVTLTDRAVTVTTERVSSVVSISADADNRYDFLRKWFCGNDFGKP
jgi:hypothetical protein